MAIKVKDALNLPIMQDTNLLAGNSGINNHIKWVTIVEVLEDIERLQEGEFLITTGFELLEDKDRLNTFHDLLSSKILSGVAIYKNIYMEEIPNSFIDLANVNDLPLIEIPIDINFSEITKAILKQIVNKQIHLLEQSESIHKELTNLILNDQSLVEVTKKLAQLTSSSMIVYNEFYDVIFSQDFNHDITLVKIDKTSVSISNEEIDLTQYLIESLEMESKVSITLGNYIFTIYPIIAKQSCFGWIVMIKLHEQWQELDDIAIEQATTIYAMEFLKKTAIEETQLRIQSNLLEDIFSENYVNKKIIFDQALKLEYDITLNQSVFHLTFKKLNEINGGVMNKLYHLTEQLLIKKNKQHIIQMKVNSIILLTNVIGESDSEIYNHTMRLADELFKEWNFYFPKIHLMIGIGKDYNTVEKLGESARESQYAAQLSNLIDSTSHIMHYTNLGMYSLLLDMKQAGIDLATIYEKHISELFRGSNKEIDLIETLNVYFKENQSIQNSAKKLFIHRHTLRYRLNQIEVRTGLDIKSSDDQLKLQFSLMSYKLESLLNISD